MPKAHFHVYHTLLYITRYCTAHFTVQDNLLYSTLYFAQNFSKVHIISTCVARYIYLCCQVHLPATPCLGPGGSHQTLPQEHWLHDGQLYNDDDGSDVSELKHLEENQLQDCGSKREKLVIKFLYQVRHPFVRLVSAYEDKMLNPHPFPFKYHHRCCPIKNGSNQQ